MVAVSQEAFRECNSLTDITIPGSVKRIGERAFEKVGLVGTRFIVVIPAGVSEFYANSFACFGNSGATLVALGSTVQEMLYDNLWQFYKTLENATAQIHLIRKPQDNVENPTWRGAP